MYLVNILHIYIYINYILLYVIICVIKSIEILMGFWGDTWHSYWNSSLNLKKIGKYYKNMGVGRELES